jgi:hypothetical protein
MTPILSIDPKFVFELAAGLEEPDHIAQRYHYITEAWESLKNDQNFMRVVESKRTELQKTGYTFRLKAALAAEDLLDEVYIGAKSVDASLSAKLEAFKYLTKIGNLEPKEDKQVATGPAFSIKIDLGSNSITIKNTPENDENSQNSVENVIEMACEELPSPPLGLIDQFPLTNDLHATNL